MCSRLSAEDKLCRWAEDTWPGNQGQRQAEGPRGCARQGLCAHPKAVQVEERWDATVHRAGFPWFHLWPHSNTVSSGHINTAPAPQAQRRGPRWGKKTRQITAPSSCPTEGSEKFSGQVPRSKLPSPVRLLPSFGLTWSHCT